MTTIIRRPLRASREDRNEEFERGLAEWQQWVRDEQSHANVVRRRRAAADPLEEAFFIGVLTGAKRAREDGWVPTPPKNWKGKPTGDFDPPAAPPAGKGRMKKAAQEARARWQASRTK